MDFFDDSQSYYSSHAVRRGATIFMKSTIIFFDTDLIISNVRILIVFEFSAMNLTIADLI